MESPPPLDASTFAAVLSIVLINIVLSGDNAVVIGLAARGLHGSLRNRAIVLGSLGAIVLRVAFTFVAAYLLQVPALQLVGGIVLIWIAYRLLLPDQDEGPGAAHEHGSLWRAVQTILIADVVMSLDNVLAIAGVSHGDMWLLLLGLGLSMPLIAFGGGVIARLLDALPWLVYAGSAVLAWTAGEMLLEDHYVHPIFEAYPVVGALPPLITFAVIAAGFLARRGARAPDAPPSG